MSATPTSPSEADPPRPDPRLALRDALHRARWRKAIADALHGTESFAVTLPVAAAGLILVMKGFDPGGASLLLPIAAGALGLVLVALGARLLFALRNSAAPNRVAWELDRRLGLRDAFTTSVEVASSSEPGLFDATLLERTASSLDGKKVASAFPVLWLRPAWVTSALLLFAILLIPPWLGDAVDPPVEEPASSPKARDGEKDPDPAAKKGAVPAAGARKNLPTPSPDPRNVRGNPDPQYPPAPSPADNSRGGGKGEEKGGSKPPLLGDPERTPASFDDVEVKPFFGPKGKTRLIEMEVPIPRVTGEKEGPGAGKDPVEQMNQLLIRYKKRAEHALSSGRIGRGDRKTVLGYFERVREMLEGK